METPEDKRRRQDLDDFNNESADRDTGRMRRFLPESHRQSEQQKKRDEQARMSRLAAMLADPAYAQAYEDTGEAIDRAQAAADRALLRAANAIERLSRQLEELERRADRLRGEAVFRGADGKYRRADGSAVSDEETALVVRSENPSSYETYLQNADALRAAQERRDRVLEIQSEVIDPARERHQDHDNPFSADELNRVTERMAEATREMNLDISSEFSAAASAEAPQRREAELTAAPPPLLTIPGIR